MPKSNRNAMSSPEISSRDKEDQKQDLKTVLRKMNISFLPHNGFNLFKKIKNCLSKLF